MGDNPAAQGNDVFGHLLPRNFAAAHPSGPHPRGSPTATPPAPQAGPLHTAAQELAAESESWGQDVDVGNGSAACCDSSSVQRWHDQGRQANCGQQGDTFPPLSPSPRHCIQEQQACRDIGMYGQAPLTFADVVACMPSVDSSKRDESETSLSHLLMYCILKSEVMEAFLQSDMADNLNHNLCIACLSMGYG